MGNCRNALLTQAPKVQSAYTYDMTSRLTPSAHALFLAALIVFLPLNGSAQKSKTPNIVPPGAGNGANVGSTPGAAAITQVTLAVPSANSAPRTVSMAAAMFPSAALPSGAVVTGPMATAPRASAAPQKASPLQTPKADGASIAPSRNAPTTVDDTAPKAGSIDFDGGVERKKLDGDPAVAAAAPSARPSIRRPYQLALVGNEVPASFIARLDALIAARHPGDQSDTHVGLAHTVRTANIVAAMGKAAKERPNGQMLLVFSALLRDIPPGDFAVENLFGDLPKNLLFNTHLIPAVVAASNPGPDSGRATSAAQSDKLLARQRVWADRWGRRLSFAADIADFTGTQTEVMRAARAAASVSGQPVPSDEQVAVRASARLSALMENSSFALLPQALRANVEESARFLRLKEGPPLAPGTINESARAQAPPRRDSSVEIEVDTYPQILKLLTTADGTVGGLLGDLAPPEGSPARDVAWDSLSPGVQLDLLKFVSAHKTTTFFDDRRITHMHVKKKAVLKFVKETTFLGKTYPPGRHLVDISRALRDIVEYRGADEVNTVTGVELHFRDDQSAGAVSNDARRLLEGIGVPITHQHVHIVAPLPIEALEREPDVQAAAMGDFYRRVNLLAEMTTIIDDGASVDMNVSGKITYFGYAKPWTISGVTEYFENAALRRYWPIQDTFKIAWVGFRGSDKYDQPGLYGFEYRAISAGANETDYRDILDRIQQSMLRDDYGIAKDRIRQWLAGRTASNAVTDAWYNQDWSVLVRNAKPEAKEALGLTGIFNRILWEVGIKKTFGWDQDSHTELKMLMHDWSKDPLTFQDEAFQRKIADQQLRALARYRKGESVNALISDFLLDSGLYAAVSRSIGPSGR
jgi:hypothetical protein